MIQIDRITDRAGGKNSRIAPEMRNFVALRSAEAGGQL
jgi:hypothetical protein